MPESLCVGAENDERVKFRRVCDYDEVARLLDAEFDVESCEFLHPNESIGSLLAKLGEIVDRCTKLKRVKNKSFSAQPWLSDRNFLALCRHKRTLVRRLRRNPGDVLLSEELSEVSLRVKNAKADLKKRYFLRKFETGRSCREKWNELNRVLGRKKSETAVKRLLKRDGTGTVSDAKGISNEFNEYFTKIARDLRRRIPGASTNPNLPRGRNYGTFFMFPSNESEVLTQLRKLGEGKAPGIDGISNKILKFLAVPLSRILSVIFNRILDLGAYPDSLKRAWVKPIHKSGPRDDPANYRPISILSGFNKVFEVLLNERILKFLKLRGFLNVHQYGFRRLSNTVTAAYEALNFIYKGLDSSFIKLVSGLFLDLSKAFDMVDHRVLLSKLYDHGFRGPIHSILESYLANRTQCVKCGGEMGDELPVTLGVPQGSVLGPTLFLIYINDITELGLNGKIFLYADDAAIFYPGFSKRANCVLINEDLRVLSEYFDRNLLLLNHSKTKVMHICSVRQELDASDAVRIDQNVVQEVDEMNYLGLVIDKHLNWSSQCRSVVRKVASGVSALFQCRKFLPVDVMMKLYHSFVHVHLSYMVGVWGNSHWCYLKPLQVLQNRALKLVLGLSPRTSSVELYLLHVRNVLPIRGLCELNVVKHVKKCLESEVHNNFNFAFREQVMNFRDNYRLFVVFSRTQMGGNQIESMGADIFNRLPIEIRQIESTSVFVSRVKQHFLGRESLEAFLT